MNPKGQRQSCFSMVDVIVVMECTKNHEWRAIVYLNYLFRRQVHILLDWHNGSTSCGKHTK